MNSVLAALQYLPGHCTHGNKLTLHKRTDTSTREEKATRAAKALLTVGVISLYLINPSNF